MRTHIFFILGVLLFALPVSAGNAGLSSTIFLPEDELTLPPLLKEIQSEDEPEDRVNLKGLDHHEHNAHQGEWLDFGDTISVPARLSFQIIQKENIQWVGGGVFTGQIGSGRSVKDDNVHEVRLTRGWMKAWVKPNALHSTFRVITNAGNFVTSNAVFWLYSRVDHTEVYLLSGELKMEASKKSFRDKGYAIFEKGAKEPLYVSTDWAPKAIEVKIAGSYPHFVKLVDRAEEQWDDGWAEKTYATFRKKGWRKASRLDPSTK